MLVRCVAVQDACCMQVSNFYVPETSIFRLETIKYKVILHVALTNNEYFALLFGHIKIETAHILRLMTYGISAQTLFGAQ